MLQNPLRVIQDDFRFANTTGLMDQQYGTGKDCYDEKSQNAKGGFQIDLRGTRFKLHPNVTWITDVDSHHSKTEMINFTLDDTRQLVKAKCGGWSLGCKVDGPMLLIPIN